MNQDFINRVEYLLEEFPDATIKDAFEFNEPEIDPEEQVKFEEKMKAIKLNALKLANGEL